MFSYNNFTINLLYYIILFQQHLFHGTAYIIPIRNY
nr:MAG TPA: hypothetical protein [Caudoviricetes sp.]